MCGGKSITKLVDSKSVTDRKVLKYSLTTQEFSAGEIEMTIYKGDVLATKGGGAQVNAELIVFHFKFPYI